MTSSKYKNRLLRSRRDEILGVLVEMIEAGDLEAFSLRGVAKSIGMDATTLNHHFGGWADLSLLLMQTLAGKRLGRLERSLENLDSLEQLPSFLRGNLTPKVSKQLKSVWQWVVAWSVAEQGAFAKVLAAHQAQLAQLVGMRLQAIGIEPGTAVALADVVVVLDSGVTVTGGLSNSAAASLEMLSFATPAERKVAANKPTDTQQMALTW